MRAWFALVKTTILPRQEEIEQQILANLHLFDEDPDGRHVVNSLVTQLFAYGAEYRRVVAMWDAGDYTHITSTVGFPVKVVAYFNHAFFRKKGELAKLTYELQTYDCCFADNNEGISAVHM